MMGRGFEGRWLAHRLTAMGHTVKLLTPESVRPFASIRCD